MGPMLFTNHVVGDGLKMREKGVLMIDIITAFQSVKRSGGSVSIPHSRANSNLCSRIPRALDGRRARPGRGRF